MIGIKQLLQILQENPAVRNLCAGKSELGNLSLSEEALLLAAWFTRQPQTLLVVKNNSYTAQRLHERLTPLLPEDALLLVMEESLRVEAIAASPQAKAEQLEVMAKILQRKRPYILIVNAAAFHRLLPSLALFRSHCFHLHIDDEIEYDVLKQRLQSSGYTKVSHVDQPLCYAARGGIVDVYSMNYEHPVRIEFFDNIVESIRFFDAGSQRAQ